MNGNSLQLILGIPPESPVLTVGENPGEWGAIFGNNTVCPRLTGDESGPGTFGLIIYHCSLTVDSGGFRRDMAHAAKLLAGHGVILVLAEKVFSFGNLKKILKGDPGILVRGLRRGALPVERILSESGFGQVRRFYVLPKLGEPKEMVAEGSPLLELPNYCHPGLRVAKRLGWYGFIADGVAFFGSRAPMEASGILQHIISAISGKIGDCSKSWVLERIDVRWRGTLVLFLTQRSSGGCIIARIVSDHEIDRIVGKNHLFLQAFADTSVLSPGFRELIPRPLCRLEHAGATVYVESMLNGIPAWKANLRRLKDVVSRNASAFLLELARATEKDERLHDGLLDDLFWEDLVLIGNSNVIRQDFREDLLILVKDLKDVLRDRNVRMTTSHGDYGYGNILADQRTGALTGIIDWDTARTRDFPGIDLFNLRVQKSRAEKGCGILVGFMEVIKEVAIDGGNAELKSYLGKMKLDSSLYGIALYFCYLRYITRSLQYPDLFFVEQEEFRAVLCRLRDAVSL